MSRTEADFRAAGFNGFEAPVLVTLYSYLNDADTPPLLTVNEDDLIISGDKDVFAQAASQSFLPQNVAEKRRSGEITQKDIKRKLQAGRNIVRKFKAEMFTDRLIVATQATDTCRSIFRVATGREFVPVFEEDTVEEATHRVGDYVHDVLQGGRHTVDVRSGRRGGRVLQNAAMHRLTDTIEQKFDFEEHPEPAKILTGMAGQNTRKKVLLYVKELREVSKDFDRINRADKERLKEFMDQRSEVHQNGLDLHDLIGTAKVG